MLTTGCAPRDVLQEILADHLDPAALQSWERHFSECAHCRSQLESIAGTPDDWHEVASQLSSSENARAMNAGTSNPPVEAGLARVKHDQAGHVHWRDMLAPPSHPELLGRIGRYEVERLIGQGGFGVVFKAQDTELNRPVAIKVLSAHLANHGAARKRFAREAQAAAAINHPNVVTIHAVDAETKFPYLVMTYIPGHSLQELIEQRGPLDVKSIVSIGMQIAAGLDAAHRQGLVHRDIKPANILLENDLQRALITDFGLARAADDAALTRSGWLAGTPYYMSPEQAQGRDIDARSDLFSLGSVLYFLATGREPFRADQPFGVLQKIVNHRPMSVRALNADIPLPLSQFIERLMEKRPGDRIASARAASQWLADYLAYLQRPQDHRQPRVNMSPRIMRSAKRSAVVAMLLALMAFVWFGWPKPWSRGTSGPMESSLSRPSPFALIREWTAEILSEESAWRDLQIEIHELGLAIKQLECAADWLEMGTYFSDGGWADEVMNLKRDIDQIEFDWMLKNP